MELENLWPKDPLSLDSRASPVTLRRQLAPQIMARDFLFDIGNVILRFDFSSIIKTLSEHSTLADGDPIALIQDHKDDLESGRIDDETFVTTSIRLLGFTGTPDDFTRIWCEIFEINEPMAAIIEDLAKSGHRLYLLSNTSGLHKDYFHKTYPIFECFRGGVYSHTAQSMKPETGIFEQAFTEFGLSPANTVYIDDHPDNIATGKKLGLHSILYDPNRHEELTPKLNAAGIAYP